MSEVRGQRTEDRGRRTKDGGRSTENRARRIEEEMMEQREDDEEVQAGVSRRALLLARVIAQAWKRQ